MAGAAVPPLGQNNRVEVDGSPITADNDADDYDAPNNRRAILLQPIGPNPGESGDQFVLRVQWTLWAIHDGRDKVFVQYAPKGV